MERKGRQVGAASLRDEEWEDTAGGRSAACACLCSPMITPLTLPPRRLRLAGLGRCRAAEHLDAGRVCVRQGLGGRDRRDAGCCGDCGSGGAAVVGRQPMGLWAATAHPCKCHRKGALWISSGYVEDWRDAGGRACGSCRCWCCSSPSATGSMAIFPVARVRCECTSALCNAGWEPLLRRIHDNHTYRGH